MKLKIKHIHNLTQKPINFAHSLCQVFECSLTEKFGFYENSIYFLDENSLHFAEPIKTSLKNSYCFLIYPKESLKNTNIDINQHIDGYFVDGDCDIESKLKIILSGMQNIPFSDIFSNTNPSTLKFSVDKHKVLNEFSNALKSFPSINERLQSFIINTLDELLLNAIYDAPIDLASKKYTLKNMCRDAILIFDKPVDLDIIIGNSFIAISVCDHYGSFDYDTLNKSIAKNNQINHYKPIDDSISLGGGLGLSLSFNRGASFCFYSEQNVITRTIAYFPLCDEYRNFRKHEKFLLNLLYKK